MLLYRINNTGLNDVRDSILLLTIASHIFFKLKILKEDFGSARRNMYHCYPNVSDTQMKPAKILKCNVDGCTYTAAYQRYT